MLSPEDHERLKKLIEEDKNKTWYTIKELKVLSNFSEGDIIDTISTDPNFVRSTQLSNDNLARFTTRNDYNQNATFLNRMIGGFKNRID